jgi:hypothetical protein
VKNRKANNYRKRISEVVNIVGMSDHPKNRMVNIVGMTQAFITERGGQDRENDPDRAPKKEVVNIIGIMWST